MKKVTKWYYLNVLRYVNDTNAMLFGIDILEEVMGNKTVKCYNTHKENRGLLWTYKIGNKIIKYKTELYDKYYTRIEKELPFNKRVKLLQKVSTAKTLQKYIPEYEFYDDKIVREYIKGKTLEKYWETATRKNKRKITNQLIHFITILHATGHIHGDLKPKNIIVTPKHQIRIIDWDRIMPLTNKNQHRDYITLANIISANP